MRLSRSLAVTVSALSLLCGHPAPAEPTGSVAQDPTTGFGAHRHGHEALRSNLAPAQPIVRNASGQAQPYSGPSIDVLTYHYDNLRTGWNPRETDLTPASVKSSKFGLLKTLAVDGNVLAQPLLVSGFVMPDGTRHDILIVVTGRNTVYAFDAKSYDTLWQASLGTPQSSLDVKCGDLWPEYGIDSAPVIVRKSASVATLYAVAATEPSPNKFQHALHAIDIGTGKDVAPPGEINPSATLIDGSELKFDAQNQWVRAGLAYANGFIYVTLSSHCDFNKENISGWVMSYDTKLRLHRAFHTIETPTPGSTELASIWMTGFAPAIDSGGNVYVVTGNGAYKSPGRDFGQSALKLSAALHLVDRFTDSDYELLNSNDADFGAGGIMLLPNLGTGTPPLAAALGKNNNLHLLNRSSMGGLKPNNGGTLQTLKVTGRGLWGGPAYYAGPNGPTIFVQTGHDVLKSYSVSTGAGPRLTEFRQGTTAAGWGGSIPEVTSNGATAGSGVVWLLRRTDPVELEAYDAAKLGDPLFSANIGHWSGSANSFLTPIAANGRVYAPNYKTVSVFGLAQ